MPTIKLNGRINKTYRLIAGAFALGVCILLKGKKKKPLKKYVKRYKRVSKTAYGTLDAIDKKIAANNAKQEALDYQKCLEIYNSNIYNGSNNNGDEQC